MPVYFQKGGECCTASYSEAPAGPLVFAETDGTFSGMPVFSNIGALKTKTTGDGRKIGLGWKGFVVIVK